MLKTPIAGAVYFALVFTCGFVLGAVRTLWIAPRTGPLGAVLLELPLILAVSWLACLWCVRHMAVPDRAGARASMGLTAFVLLLVVEFGMAALTGQSPGGYLRAMATPAGVAGLLGQILFALLPLLQAMPPHRVGT